MLRDGAQKRSSDALWAPFVTPAVTQGGEEGDRPMAPPFDDIDDFVQAAAPDSATNDQRVPMTSRSAWCCDRRQQAVSFDL